MEQNPVARVVGYVVGPIVEVVGRRVEERVRRAVPGPPWWAVPVLLVVAVVGVLVEAAWSERERAEPEPEATAERGTTSASDGGPSVEEALEVLEVAPPPEPEQEDVRAAYRRLALETHPDRGGSAERFREVREAWEAVAGSCLV